jgi:hypothetical protein
MKLSLTIALSSLMLSAPAFAETALPATPPPSAPVSKDAKTDFTKPFVYDRLSQQAPRPHVDHPTVELTAGPEAKPQP